MTRVDKQGIALWKIVLLVACILAVGTATYAVGSLQLNTVTPDHEAWLNQHTVRIAVQYAGLVGTASILVDGHALPTEVQSDKKEIVATAPDLKDGSHDVQVQAHRALGIGEVDRAWKINVDTRPPVVSLVSPKAGTIVKDKMLKLEGHTKPGTRLTVKISGKGYNNELSPIVADASGNFSTTVEVVDDKNKVHIDALDRAGNAAHLDREILCDLVPPVIGEVTPAVDTVIKESPDVTVTAQVEEKGSGIKRATLTIDGHDQKITLPPMGGEMSVKLSDIPEGERVIALEVEDRAGWKARKEWKFLVDTSETFGMRPMTLGARGQDVATLQKRLIKWGALPKDRSTSVYDEATKNAVQDFQTKHAIDVDGMVGFKTIAALSPKIVINLSDFSLTLIDGGKKVKAYKVAHGMPQFPTPTGNYRVTFLEKNPTWIPPKDSVWAKEAKVTPPGPGNPLGTRWIGLDSNAVGIHGTPMAWSVGSRASHGCIRMRIPDVEDLFERVNPGCQVSISWGAEKPAKN